MQVPSKRRWPFAAAVIALFASVIGVAHAVEFDERMKAPMVKDGAELKAKLESFRSLVAGINAQSPLELVRDRGALKDRFDARWLIGRMVDERVPLAELESLGFEVRADGSLRIDTLKHREWRPLDTNLTMFADPGVVDGFAFDLTARGFRPEDFDAMKKYVATRNLHRERSDAKLKVVLAAAKVARKMEKLKRPVDEQWMLSYFYQKGIAIAAVDQEWAAGLLDVLDAQRQRALGSYLAEAEGSFTLQATDTKAALDMERQILIKPDLETIAKEAAAEGRL